MPDLAQLERALELSADMQRRGVARNVHTHSALMNVCIKCGQLKLALEVWEDMQRDGIAPNVVRSSGCGVRVWQDMQRDALCPAWCARSPALRCLL